jgi:methyl-accepting chemotaxis protein
MKKIGLSQIRRWLLLCLIMVSMAAMAIFLLVYFEISSVIETGAAAGGIQTGQVDPVTIRTALMGLRLRLVLLFGGALIFLFIAGYAWMAMAARRIEKPLRIIERALGQLARGRLNETVVVDTPDEFGRIGAGINEVAVNLQELLLYIWKQTGHCLTLLDQINNHPDLCRDRHLTLETLGYLKQLAEAIDDLREMAKAYVFYDVSIEGNRTHAINEPGRETTDGR